jgi:His-Xaa-Ser system protein HxsD
VSEASTPTHADFVYTVDGRSVGLLLDEDLYPRDAIYGAAYLFVDRAYVFLERPAERRVQVRLRAKESATPEQVDAIAGEFCNELLNQVLRLRIAESTKTIREYYMARAFFGDDTRASIDALLAQLDQEELESDPLAIAVPWEQGPGPGDTERGGEPGGGRGG